MPGTWAALGECQELRWENEIRHPVYYVGVIGARRDWTQGNQSEDHDSSMICLRIVGGGEVRMAPYDLQKVSLAGLVTHEPEVGGMMEGWGMMIPNT